MSERTVTIARGIYTITATLKKNESRMYAEECCNQIHSVRAGDHLFVLDEMTESQLRAFDNTCHDLGIDLFGEVDAWIREQEENPDDNYTEEVRGHEAYLDRGISPRDFI